MVTQIRVAQRADAGTEDTQTQNYEKASPSTISQYMSCSIDLNSHVVLI